MPTTSLARTMGASDAASAKIEAFPDPLASSKQDPGSPPTHPCHPPGGACSSSRWRKRRERRRRSRPALLPHGRRLPTCQPPRLQGRWAQATRHRPKSRRFPTRSRHPSRSLSHPSLPSSWRSLLEQPVEKKERTTAALPSSPTVSSAQAPKMPATSLARTMGGSDAASAKIEAFPDPLASSKQFWSSRTHPCHPPGGACSSSRWRKRRGRRQRSRPAAYCLIGAGFQDASLRCARRA